MQLTNINISEFEEFYRELKKSFIEDERRDFGNALRLFKDGKYEVRSIISDGKRVGFISLWHTPDFVFAEHFVIHEEYRNLGLGAKALCELKRLFSKIVLEAEPPIEEIAKRRLAFYKRNGFIENEGAYAQPAYRKGASEVPLVIMSYPERLENFKSAVSQIKKTVYSDLGGNNFK